MRHVAHTHERIVSHIRTSRMPHMNESHLTYEWCKGLPSRINADGGVCIQSGNDQSEAYLCRSLSTKNLNVVADLREETCKDMRSNGSSSTAFVNWTLHSTRNHHSYTDWTRGLGLIVCVQSSVKIVENFLLIESNTHCATSMSTPFTHPALPAA